MIRTIITFIMISAFWSSPLYAFTLTNSLSEEIAPTIETESDELGILVTYTFPGAYCYEDDLYPATYHFVIPGFGLTMEAEKPEVPIHWDTFEIPLGYEAETISINNDYTIIETKLAPSRTDLINSSDEAYSLNNVPPIRDFVGWVPTNNVEQGDIKIYRDRNILFIAVYPISYNMQQGLVRATEQLSYRINFVPAITPYSEVSNTKIYHDVDADYLDNVLTGSYHVINSLGDNSLEAQVNGFGWVEGDGYLILSRGLYSPAVEKFARWKNKMGYNVEIVNNENWTTTKIKQTVSQKYAANPKLKYLLLVGDEKDLPGELHQDDHYAFYTDYFYACMDENDDLPDLAYGRLSVTSLEEAQNVVDKIINYESLNSEGCYQDGSAIHCAEFTDLNQDGYEDRRFTRTSEDIADGITDEGKSVVRIYFKKDNLTYNVPPTNWAKQGSGYGYGEAIPDFLKAKTFNWKQNQDQIKSAINAGGLYVLHRDHGDIQKWSNPEFTNDDVTALNNGAATPIVFSINCLTGMFQYYPCPSAQGYKAPKDLSNGRSTCLAEAFIRHKNGGAVGVVGATQESYSKCNDAFAMELFQLMWPSSTFCQPFPSYTPSVAYANAEPIRKMGDLLNASRLRVATNFKGSSVHNNHIYHYFGDPSMEIKDVIPTKPNITVTQSPSSLNSEYTLKVLGDYKLVRISLKNELKVESLNGIPYKLSKADISNYAYYVIGSDIAPTPLANYFTQPSSEMSDAITQIVKEGDALEVNYTLSLDNNDAHILVRDVASGNSNTETCELSEDKIIIALPNGGGEIYNVELWNNGIIIDSQKIIVK